MRCVYLGPDDPIPACKGIIALLEEQIGGTFLVKSGDRMVRVIIPHHEFPETLAWLPDELERYDLEAIFIRRLDREKMTFH